MVSLDCRPIAETTVQALAHAITHRGTEAPRVLRFEPALLVHAMLAVTPESQHEPQPLLDGAAALAVVADLRLDYRDELTRLLNLSSTSECPVGDAQLVLAAYERWGEECPAHLDGDFAFALWDSRRQTLFCARDPFGVKPFVYCLGAGTQFVFASQMRALLAVPGVPHQLDEQRIADFIVVYFNDTQSTFYSGIQRLAGGCSLTLRNGKLSVARYWSPDRVRPLRLSSCAEYAAGYHEHFSNAVRTRMRVKQNSELGSMLSGGLDSSAISCFVRDERSPQAVPLPVFSWIFSNAMEADEREYQQILVDSGGFAQHVIDSAATDYSPWTGIERFFPDGPLYAPNFYLNDGAAQRAHQAGVRAILDGVGGDSIISHGSARFVELLGRGRVLTLASELRALARHQGLHASPAHLFFANVVAPLTPPVLRSAARRVRGKRAEVASSALLSSSLARRVDIRHAHYRPFFTVRQRHIADLQSPLLAEGLELFDRVLAEAGVEGRYPFFDRRLAEYCISLPADQKLAGGYSRIVARRAMDGSVPRAVQWRCDKGKPGLHIIHALRADRARLDDLFLRDPEVIAPYVNIDAVRELYRDFLEQRSPEFTGVIRLWSVAVLGYWLRQVRSLSG